MLTAAVWGFFTIVAYCAFWLLVGVWEVTAAAFRAIFGGRGRGGNAGMIG